MFATTVQAELKTRRFMFAKVACNMSSLIAAISRRMLFSSSCMVRGLLKGKAYANKPRTIQELEKQHST